jgi:hypothetical protein
MPALFVWLPEKLVQYRAHKQAVGIAINRLLTCAVLYRCLKTIKDVL